MALLNGIRVTLLGATNLLLTAGPNILGFNGMTTAAGAVDGDTYQWVLEANFNSQGVATAREGGTGVFSLGSGTLARNTVWSTNPGNTQLTITGTTHLIVTPMAEQLLANTVVVVGTLWNVTTEQVLLINRASGTSTTIQLPSGTTRQGGPLTVKDIQGNALSNPTTITAFGGEFIDGSTSYVINTNYGSVIINPMQTGAIASGWYISAQKNT